MNLRFIFLAHILMLDFASQAQIPNGYYATATGEGYTLKTQLHNIIDGHSTRSYGSMWDFIDDYERDSYYENDNSVLDIYSENPSGADPYNWVAVSNQCGNYSGESSCYNREHSFPKSWFDGASPMLTDAVHLFPTDGYVNGQRNNFPFGEVGSASFTSLNGSKKGSARSDLGYTGTVFEPIDEFKGDLARVYFYMATRYEDVLSSWSSVMLDGSTDQVYEDWAIDMLMDWHLNDPVSQKETDRNNNLQTYQGNRNPFVDHPEYVNVIWGDGEVSPVITLSNTSTIDLGLIPTGNSSNSVNYSVSGNNLEENITVSVSSPFELSLDDNNWQSQVNIAQANAEDGSNNGLYVRFSPQIADGNTYTGTIVHASSNAITVNRTVTGVEGTEIINTVSQLRTGSDNDDFMIEGIVTSPELGSSSGQYFIQDDTGGVFVYDSGNPSQVSRGDLVRITGTRDTYRNQVEMIPETNGLEVISSNQTIPNPIDISSSDLTTSSTYLGQLVRISGVTLTGSWPSSSSSSGTNVNASANGTSFILRIDENSYFDGTTQPSGNLLVTGVLDVYDSDIQIFPFVSSDIKEESTLDPSISSSVTSINFGDVTVGNDAVSELTVSGLDLSENVSVSASGVYTLGLDVNGPFTSQVSLGVSNGVLSDQLFIRFSPSGEGENPSNILIQSSGESLSISVAGLGVDVPESSLTGDYNSFDGGFGQVEVGEYSALSSFSLTPSNLPGNISIAAPDGFELSLSSNADFSETLNVSGSVTSSGIYVRFVPTEAKSYSGNVVSTSGQLSTTIAVSGTGYQVLSAKDNPEVVFFPNPTNGYLFFQNLDIHTSEIKIFDSMGRRQSFKIDEGQINISELSEGLYYLSYLIGGQNKVGKFRLK